LWQTVVPQETGPPSTAARKQESEMNSMTALQG